MKKKGDKKNPMQYADTTFLHDAGRHDHALSTGERKPELEYYLERAFDENIVPIDGFFVAEIVVVNKSHSPSFDFPQTRPS